MCQEIKFAPYEHYFMRRSAADEAKTVQEEGKPIMSSSIVHYSGLVLDQKRYLCSTSAVTMQ